jgi:hypothetical protein
MKLSMVEFKQSIKGDLIKAMLPLPPPKENEDKKLVKKRKYFMLLRFSIMSVMVDLVFLMCQIVGLTSERWLKSDTISPIQMQASMAMIANNGIFWHMVLASMFFQRMKDLVQQYQNTQIGSGFDESKKFQDTVVIK